MFDSKKGLDLSTQPPRSPRIELGGFVILARTIDKCRALLWGKLGEYDFDCELDKSLLDWKGLTGDMLKSFISEGHSDDEIVMWVKAKGTSKTDAEIAEWTATAIANKYQDDEEGQVWLNAQIKRLNIPADSTLFDYLDADDRASFK